MLQVSCPRLPSITVLGHAVVQWPATAYATENEKPSILNLVLSPTTESSQNHLNFIVIFLLPYFTATQKRNC